MLSLLFLMLLMLLLLLLFLMLLYIAAHVVSVRALVVAACCHCSLAGAFAATPRTVCKALTSDQRGRKREAGKLLAIAQRY
jgi:hypothetical protein